MRLSLFTVFLVLLTQPLWAASVDVKLLRSIPLEVTPKQVVASADGQRIYLLTDNGELQLFSSDGQFQGSFPVGPEVTGIAPQGANRLVLISAERKELLLVGLEPVVEITTKGAPTLGPEDAPVTIAVFDDFECPYCANVAPLLKEVQHAYADQVKLVFKNFPLGMHKHARMAATAALAAQRQGKFWPLHDLLFANYKQLNQEKIRQLAEQVGLDMAQFDKDSADPEILQKIEADIKEGQRIGVRGTPSIFVNGRILPQRSRAAFDYLIQSELAKQEQDKAQQ